MNPHRTPGQSRARKRQHRQTRMSADAVGLGVGDGRPPSAADAAAGGFAPNTHASTVPVAVSAMPVTQAVWGTSLQQHQQLSQAVRTHQNDTVQAHLAAYAPHPHPQDVSDSLMAYSAPHTQYPGTSTTLATASQLANAASMAANLNGAMASDLNGAEAHHLQAHDAPHSSNQRDAQRAAGNRDFQRYGAPSQPTGGVESKPVSPANIPSSMPPSTRHSGRQSTANSWGQASTGTSTDTGTSTGTGTDQAQASQSAQLPAPPALPRSTSPIPPLAPPPEATYHSFDELLTDVQKWAKDQGYGVVKLRASNYRDNRPTRYDLVCDRGGVPYRSTAKKRNPSTRKVDCPWRAKGVCEVSLGNKWRFAVQDGRHNHEPRIGNIVPDQDNTPAAQSFRSVASKLDRMALDMNEGFVRLESSLLDEINQSLSRLESSMTHRLDNIEHRLGALEEPTAARASLMGGSNVPPMNTANMSTASMGGGGMNSGGLNGPDMRGGGMGNGLGGGSLSNGAMGSPPLDRMNNVEARLTALEHQRAIDGMPMAMDDDPSRMMMVGS